jgi:hypothetical protein
MGVPKHLIYSQTTGYTASCHRHWQFLGGQMWFVPFIQRRCEGLSVWLPAIRVAGYWVSGHPAAMCLPYYATVQDYLEVSIISALSGERTNGGGIDLECRHPENRQLYAYGPKNCSKTPHWLSWSKNPLLLWICKVHCHIHKSLRMDFILSHLNPVHIFLSNFFKTVFNKGLSPDTLQMNQDSTVGTTTGYGLDDQGVGFRVPMGARIFICPCCPDPLWSPPNLLLSGYRGLFPRG